MCIAIPAKVLSVDGFTADVERYGERLTVSLVMLDEPLAAGEYVVVQARQYAVERMDEATAAESLKLFDEIMSGLGADRQPLDQSDVT